ncbi:ChaN family lipoprotein [Vibrio sp. H11]|uniref:ChaN family lipoprotein n=1 Tax=Vibrio sp. H11 TaxID=2565928 RepID=UPI0010A63C21|nr:ChaN family lipoprotein [Vibrio sp. H11]
MRAIIYWLSSMILLGCTSTRPVQHFYDYQLATPHGKPLTLTLLPATLAAADVILVGEWHTHPGIHRFQTDLLYHLLQQKRPVALSMEQFDRSAQPTLNQYLRGDIGEQYLIKQTKAWPNYQSDYRPLVELAKQYQAPVIAANAPQDIVRCIGRQGPEYVDRLDSKQRTWIAREADSSDSPYKQRFMASMHHGTEQQNERQFAAQITWDETMAESISDYLLTHPGHQVMHIAGLFHTQEGLGIAAALQRRLPDIHILIITPVSEITADHSDYQLQVLAPPVRYIQPEHQRQAFQALAQRNDDLQCNP